MTKITWQIIMSHITFCIFLNVWLRVNWFKMTCVYFTRKQQGKLFFILINIAELNCAIDKTQGLLLKSSSHLIKWVRYFKKYTNPNNIPLCNIDLLILKNKTASYFTSKVNSLWNSRGFAIWIWRLWWTIDKSPKQRRGARSYRGKEETGRGCFTEFSLTELLPGQREILSSCCWEMQSNLPIE